MLENTDLDKQQKKDLLNILQNTHSHLADMYESAIYILDNQIIKDRVRAAAYCIRELLNGLPEHIDSALIKNPKKLGNLISPLLDAWECLGIENFIDISSAGSGWETDQQSTIRNFLDRFKSFAQQNNEIHTSRREKATQFVRKLNAKHSTEKLPAHQEELMGARHYKYLDYFNGVLHNSCGSTDETEFCSKVSEVEKFLIGLMEPNVHFTNSELDKIIKAGEQDAD